VSRIEIKTTHCQIRGKRPGNEKTEAKQDHCTIS
jgi:hypothetical protein